MSRILKVAAAFGVIGLTPVLASAQISFQRTGYYAALGDSVAAGTGAMPATNGYVYQLYEQGVFGPKQEVHFNSLAVRGGRSWELLTHQVPQLLCTAPALRPTIVTITAGANDFLLSDYDVPGIARRVAQAINLLLNNDNSALVSDPVRDPRTGAVCPSLRNVTILVSSYYSMPHPDPNMFALLDSALGGFNQALPYVLSLVPVPAGSRVAFVDLYTPSLGRQGLVTIERRLGYTGGFDFDIHPTNLGHTFIAKQFEEVWRSLNAQ